jgi:hypothetical protein
MTTATRRRLHRRRRRRRGGAGMTVVAKAQRARHAALTFKRRASQQRTCAALARACASWRPPPMRKLPPSACASVCQEARRTLGSQHTRAVRPWATRRRSATLHQATSAPRRRRRARQRRRTRACAGAPPSPAPCRRTACCHRSGAWRQLLPASRARGARRLLGGAAVRRRGESAQVQQK